MLAVELETDAGVDLVSGRACSTVVRQGSELKKGRY
jgi:hypothetical protein